VTYRIEFAPRVKRQLKDLPREVQQRLTPRIEALAENPRPRGVKKLVGEPGLYRLRVGYYRIIYQIRDEELFILVVKIGHRRDVYRR
jgi:mRNA interferase RelE/StbE